MYKYISVHKRKKGEVIGSLRRYIVMLRERRNKKKIRNKKKNMK